MSLSLAVAALLAALPPRAAPPATTLRAEAERGVAHFESGRFLEALAIFQRLRALEDRFYDPAGAQWNVARCLEELDRPAEATAAFEAYLEMDDTPDGHAEARRRLTRLRAEELGRVRISCRGETSLSVRVDGLSREIQTCPAELADVPAGPRWLVVRRGEAPTARLHLTVAPGRTTSVDLDRLGRLRIQCNVVGAAVKLDGIDCGRTPTGDLLVREGLRRLVVEGPSSGRWARAVSVVPGQTTLVRVALVTPTVVRSPPVTAPPRREPDGPGAAPWVLLGVGAAGIGAGVYFQETWNATREDEADVTTSITAYAAGGTAVGAALVWLLWPRDAHDARGAGSHGTAPARHELVVRPHAAPLGSAGRMTGIAAGLAVSGF